MPALIRISENLPVTHTVKVLKRPLRRERWQCEEPVWQRVDDNYKLMSSADKDALLKAFNDRGRAEVLALV